MKDVLKIGSIVDFNGTIAKVLELRENHARIEYIRSDNGKRHAPLVEYGKLSGVIFDELWLFKSGFVSRKDYWFNGVVEFSFITNDDFFEFEIKFPESKWCVSKIQFVHELQNLFTGLKLPLDQKKLFEIKK